MRIVKILLFVLVLGIIGCNKEAEDTFDPYAQQAADLEKIDNYLGTNGITDTIHHYTGIRYQVHTEGAGLHARVGDKIKVSYSGRLLDTEEVFDPGTVPFEAILNSGSMILGWYYMCQEMQEGDSITIYIPSAYGYGRDGTSGIPGNSCLIFDMKMLRVGE